ncbi:MAG: hypothetical protein HKN34_02630, partial [Gammaproteobacteria bacterium]|nr:hypothetical protein [Gammaproteobacteria bacterium]
DDDRAQQLAARMAGDDRPTQVADASVSSGLFNWRGVILVMLLAAGIWSIKRYLRGRS